MRKRIWLFVLVSSILSVLLICACAQEETPPAPAVVSVTLRIGGEDAPDKVAVDYTRIRSMTVSVKVITEGGAGKAVRYSSSDASVAEIDGNGTIRLLGDGSCTIAAVSEADGEKSDSFVLDVYYPDEAIMQEIASDGVYRLEAEEADLSAAGSNAAAEEILGEGGVPTGETAVGGLGYKGAKIVFRVRAGEAACAMLRLRVASTVEKGKGEFALDDAVLLTVNGQAYATGVTVRAVEGAADYNGYQVLEVQARLSLRRGTSEIAFTDIAGVSGRAARMPNFDWIELSVSEYGQTAG